MVARKPRHARGHARLRRWQTGVGGMTSEAQPQMMVDGGSTRPTRLDRLDFSDGCLLGELLLEARHESTARGILAFE